MRRVGELEKMTDLRIYGPAVDDDDLIACGKAQGLKHLQVVGIR